MAKKTKKLSNPIERARQVEELVCRGDRRLYYDFTCSGDHGGSVKACAVGCNLKCSFCWSIGRDHPKEEEFCQMMSSLKKRSTDFPDPSASYRFYSPKEAVDEMIRCARGRIYSDGLQGIYEKEFMPIKEPDKKILLFCLSGGEATLGHAHLIGILKELKRQGEEENMFYTIIIYTNGMLLGENPNLVDQIKEYSDFSTVRVSLKAATPELFSRFIGADPSFFEYPFRALEKLHKVDMIAWASIIDNPVMFPPNSRDKIVKRLRSIDPKLVDSLEYERLAFDGIQKREEIFWQEFKRRKHLNMV